MPLEELAFAPVPVAPRSDGWTGERQVGFVLRLALGGSVTLAARAVGKNPASAYRLRKRPGGEGFAAAWDRALLWGQDRTTDIALQRALEGDVRPVYYRGIKRGEYVRHDNRLAMTVLNRLDRAAANNPVPPDIIDLLLNGLEEPQLKTKGF